MVGEAVALVADFGDAGFDARFAEDAGDVEEVVAEVDDGSFDHLR